MHVIDPVQVRGLVERVPVAYLVFDLLHLDGRDLLDLPYDGRRELLEELELDGAGSSPCRRRSPATGRRRWRRAGSGGLEGVVAKRRDSRYEAGPAVAGSWVKVKHVRTQEVVIGGWQPGEGRRDGRASGRCCSASRARTAWRTSATSAPGSPTRCSTTSRRRLRPLQRATSPFAGRAAACRTRATRCRSSPSSSARWRSASGRRTTGCATRCWRGLRPDKSPADVVRES